MVGLGFPFYTTSQYFPFYFYLFIGLDGHSWIYLRLYFCYSQTLNQRYRNLLMFRVYLGYALINLLVARKNQAQTLVNSEMQEHLEN